MDILNDIDRWIASLPQSLPMLTSLVSTAISVAAYRRASPPRWPEITVDTVSTGPGGGVFRATVINRTGRHVRVDRISAGPGRIARHPAPDGQSLADWRDALDVGAISSPSSPGPLVISFALRRAENSPWAADCIVVALSINRRTSSRRTIIIPIMVRDDASISK